MFGRLKRWLVLRQLRRILERLDKGGHMQFLKAFFGGSKKATAVVVAILTVVLREYLGLDEAMIAKILQLIMTYIGGQAAVDLALAFSGKKES